MTKEQTEKYTGPGLGQTDCCPAQRQLTGKESLKLLINRYRNYAQQLEDIYNMLPESPTYEQNIALIAIVNKLNN